MVAAVATLCFAISADAADIDAAIRAFEDGKAERALQLVRAHMQSDERAGRDDAGDTEQLLQAFSLLRLRRAEQSALALEALASDGPEMGSYLTFLRTGVAAARKQCHEAEALAKELPEDSAFVFGAFSRVASCAVREADEELALRCLEVLDAHATTSSHRAEIALLRGRTAEASGRGAEASDLYRRVLVDYPLHRAGRRARQRLNALKRRGVAVKPVEVIDLLPRALAERSWRRPRRARRTYRNVANHSRRMNLHDLRAQAELGLVELDMVDRRYTRAQRRLSGVLARTQDPALQAQALYLMADVLARRNRVLEAIGTAEQAMRDVPDERFTTEAAMLAARIAYGTDRHERARQLAEWVLQVHASAEVIRTVGDDGAFTPSADGDELMTEALWLLAWIAWDIGTDRAEAVAYLSQIPEEASLAPAAQYWRARAAVDAGDLDGAEALIERILELTPTSFYAFAGSELINAVRPGCNVRWSMPPPPEDVAALPQVNPRDLLGAVVLFENGLKSEARRVLRLLPSGRLSYADRLTAAWLYRNCGDVHRAAVLTRSIVGGPPQPVDSGMLLELAYPRAFGELVSAAAAEFNVPEELIFAVMREESAFNPNAVSPRQARGLMQMIRPTAWSMARKVGIRRFRLHHLFDPEVSIRLGAQYLGTLLDLFDGNIIAAAAGYHAGESAVARWLRARGELPPDEFVENIPYASTRRYVKKVMSSYGIYSLLRGCGPSPTLGVHEAPVAGGDETPTSSTPEPAKTPAQDVLSPDEASSSVQPSTDAVDSTRQAPPTSTRRAAGRRTLSGSVSTAVSTAGTLH